MAKPSNNSVLVKNVTTYIIYLVITWSIYRLLFRFSDNVEELVIKPVIWLVPLFFFLRKEGLGISSLGHTFKNFFPAMYLSLGLGSVFVLEGVLTNFLKYGHFNFGANIGSAPLFVTLGISFATAFSEETAFRGYIFSRLTVALKDEWSANVTQALLWTMIHVPVALFVFKLNLPAAMVYLGLTAIFGLGSAFIFGKTQNVWGSIFLHVLWEWPIILFR